MQALTLLDIMTIILLIIHFGVPITYYWYARTRWLPKPWNIRMNLSYKPIVTVIIPTYNEAKLIKKKLDNIIDQEYPVSKLEIIVVDSASNDGTTDLVREWIKEHPAINLKMIIESSRRGKAYALNTALAKARGEIIIITDADSWWLDSKTLKNAVKLLSDSRIGAVSCIKKPMLSGPSGIEEGYRKYYNLLRISESKAWSTPIFHGELAAFKKDILNKIGGFPTDIGADDSHVATLIALRGYRSIIHESLVCTEAVPKDRYFWWRVRRAQHLIQHFTKLLLVRAVRKEFKEILRIETFIHLFSPWFLLTAFLLVVISILRGELISILMLCIGLAGLPIIKEYRVWVYQQFTLLMAELRNIWTKELVWQKETKLGA